MRRAGGHACGPCEQLAAKEESMAKKQKPAANRPPRPSPVPARPPTFKAPNISRRPPRQPGR